MSNNQEKFPPNFLVSDRVLRLWKRGIISLNPLLHRPFAMYFFYKPGADAELRTEFAHLTFSTMITHFRWIQNDTAQTLPLFGEGSIFDQLKARYSDSIMVKENDIPEFLKLFETELQSYLRLRDPITATWGRAGMIDGRLVVELEPSEKLSLPKATSRTLRIVL
jgi:hypothetical protein